MKSCGNEKELETGIKKVGDCMGRFTGIGYQDFEAVRKENCFYVDKTQFIREWWEERDMVTLITRPRRFGKTLTMSMTVPRLRRIPVWNGRS